MYLKSFQTNSKRHRAESFEACCQRALLNVQIITLLFTFTVQKYIYPPVSKVHAGSFLVSAFLSSDSIYYRRHFWGVTPSLCGMLPNHWVAVCG